MTISVYFTTSRIVTIYIFLENVMLIWPTGHPS